CTPRVSVRSQAATHRVRRIVLPCADELQRACRTQEPQNPSEPRTSEPSNPRTTEFLQRHRHAKRAKLCGELLLVGEAMLLPALGSLVLRARLVQLEAAVFRLL